VSIYGGIDDPRGIAVNPATGRWYYTRASDHAIVDDTRAVVAGTRGVGRGIDGTGEGGRFSHAAGLALDPAGSVWLADHTTEYGGGEPFESYALRKVGVTGSVTTPIPARWIFENSSAIYGSVAVDAAGQLSFSWYFSGIPNFSRLDTSTGAVSIDRRSWDSRYTSLLDHIATNPSGLLVGTTYGGRIYQVDLDGTRTLLAGSGAATGKLDGTGAQATFGRILALTADARGDFYVLDAWEYNEGTGLYGLCYVRKITPLGVVTTVSNNVAKPASPGGVSVIPQGLAVDSRGNIYLSYAHVTTYGRLPSSGYSYRIRTVLNCIRRITPDGADDLIGTSPDVDGNSDGLTGAARFAFPDQLAVDKQDNLYLIDGYGTTLRKAEYMGTAPAITAQPQSLSVTTGASVQLSVTAAATPTPTFQWYFNGQPFQGATSSTLSFANARTSDAGDYTVVVTNSLGSVTSAKATLTVTAAPAQPPSAPSGGGGGGGAPSGWFVGALAALGVLRRFMRQSSSFR
jgi:hypothetical protein